MRKTELYRQKIGNFLHTVLLAGGMIALFALLGWALAGMTGLLFLAVFGVLLFAVTSRMSPAIVLRAYRARQLTFHEAPQLLQIVRELSSKAGLDFQPALFYIPSQMINAFSVGRRDNAAIGITDGLLRQLDMRELIGVLAHEISHIRNNDLLVMGLPI